MKNVYKDFANAEESGGEVSFPPKIWCAREEIPT
jgi:hypothetical protein